MASNQNNQNKLTRWASKDGIDYTKTSSSRLVGSSNTTFQNTTGNNDDNANVEVRNVQTTSAEETIVPSKVSAIGGDALPQNYSKKSETDVIISPDEPAIDAKIIPKDFVGKDTDEQTENKDATKQSGEMLSDNRPASKKQKADAATKILNETEQEKLLVESGYDSYIHVVKEPTTREDGTTPGDYNSSLFDPDSSNETTTNKEEISKYPISGSNTGKSKINIDLQSPNEELPVKPPRIKSKANQNNKSSEPLTKEPATEEPITEGSREGKEDIEATSKVTRLHIKIPNDFRKALAKTKHVNQPQDEKSSANEKVESSETKMPVGINITEKTSLPDYSRDEINKPNEDKKEEAENKIPSAADDVGKTTIPSSYICELNISLSRENSTNEENITMSEGSRNGQAIAQETKDESAESFEVVEANNCIDTDEENTINEPEKVVEEIIPVEAKVNDEKTIPQISLGEIKNPNIQAKNDEKEPVATDDVVMIPSQTEATGDTTVPSKHRQELNSPSQSEVDDIEENIKEARRSLHTDPSKEANVLKKDRSVSFRFIGAGLLLASGVILAIFISKRMQNA